MFVIFRTELRIKKKSQKKLLVDLNQGSVDSEAMGIQVTDPHPKDSPNPQARLHNALFPEHLLTRWGIKNLGLGPSDI